MTLKAFVLANVKPDDYYAARFPNWNPRIRGNVRCPWHDDQSPSLAIGLKNGGAHCHAACCAASIGNIVHFESRFHGLAEDLTSRKLYREFIRPIVSKKTVQEYCDALSLNSIFILKIRREMGLSLATIKNQKLGFDKESQRITIPVYDQFNQCINIRFYKLPSLRSKSDNAKIYNLKGYGRLDLFPYPKISDLPSSTPILIMASEKEAMLANQMGFTACTTTNGEGAWDDSWNSLFTGHRVVLVMDRDQGGKAALQRLQKILADSCSNACSLDLDWKTTRPDRKDFADWVLKEDGTKERLDRLIKRQALFSSKSKTESIPPSVTRRSSQSNNGTHSEGGTLEFPKLPEFVSEKLYDLASISSRSELLNRRIRTQGIVAAKSPNTYSIPWKFKIITRERSFDYELEINRELLRFVRSSDASILHALQRMVGSTSAEVIPTHYLTVTEVEVIPTSAVDQDAPYVVQRCFYFGDRIEANVPYYLEIIPTSEIRSQETIGIITGRIPLSKSIDKFELTAEISADLSVFWPEGGDVWNKLTTLANELAHSYTHIYNRLDWHLVALLSWCSPLGFRFPNDDRLQRGWINSLALGDTETGKSEVCKQLRELFQTGSFVNAENCTYVGLVGGAIKMGSGQLMLRWGRIPLCDKQLVILEELSGLSVEEISNMSDVRSSGTARLDKGGINSETNARTRLICLSNVRSERKNLSNYLYGVYAVRELIGHGEDIARFDLITTLTDKEVSIDVINATVAKRVDRTIQPDQFQKLIHFIWSLQPEQIEFTKDAYEECLEATKRLSAIYHSSIPIFKGGSGRYKLGRIAAAIACLQFAWNGSHISVGKSHVAAAVKLLRLIYNKASFGYLQYSEQMFDREQIKDESLLRKSFIERIPQSRIAKVLESLIHSTRFTRDELMAIAGIHSLHADQLIGVMVRERAISKGDANLWEIQPAGKTFMEKLMMKYDRSKSNKTIGTAN